jgi:hypothetical protein
MFADVDGQREVVEDPRGTEDDRRAGELQERLWAGRFRLQTSCSPKLMILELLIADLFSILQ